MADEFRTTMNQLPPITLDLRERERIEKQFKSSDTDKIIPHSNGRTLLTKKYDMKRDRQDAPKTVMPSKVKLEEMVSLAMIKGNSLSGPIKRMLHVPTFKIYCVKEVPIYSMETRNILK